MKRWIGTVVLMLAVIAAGATAPASYWPLVATRAAAAPCEGDECQSVPPPPDDPTPVTSVAEGPENPPVHYPKVRPAHHRKHHRHHPHRGGARP